MIRDEELKKGMMTLNFIWAAMMFALAIYLFVGLQAGESVRMSMEADTFSYLRSALYALAVVILLVTSYVKKSLLSVKGGKQHPAPGKNHPNQHPALAQYTAAMMVALAMSESIGIMGLVLFFLGKNVLDLYLLVFVSAIAMGFHRPKKEEIINLSQDSPGMAAGRVVR